MATGGCCDKAGTKQAVRMDYGLYAMLHVVLPTSADNEGSRTRSHEMGKCKSLWLMISCASWHSTAAAAHTVQNGDERFRSAGGLPPPIHLLLLSSFIDATPPVARVCSRYTQTVPTLSYERPPDTST